jgi:hypothetical protein
MSSSVCRFRHFATSASRRCNSAGCAVKCGGAHERRGLTIGPEPATGDGALGFCRALREVYGQTREQRCWVHKTANVLNVQRQFS